MTLRNRSRSSSPPTPRSCVPTNTLPVPARTQLVPKPQATQGADSNYKDPPIEPVDHASGRSRGGISTKIHTLTNGSMNIVALVLTSDRPVIIRCSSRCWIRTVPITPGEESMPQPTRRTRIRRPAADCGPDGYAIRFPNATIRSRGEKRMDLLVADHRSSMPRNTGIAMSSSVAFPG